MSQYLYLTGQSIGDSPSSPAIVRVNRQEPFLTNTTGWLVSAERWILHGVVLPVFDSSLRPITISFVSKITGEGLQATASFSQEKRTVPVQFGTKYLYDLRDVALGIQNTFNQIGNDLNIPQDHIPVISTNGRVFSITSTQAFRDQHDILVNEAFEYYFGTFDFRREDDDYVLELNQDTETQHSSTLEFLSPICRIAIGTQGLPVDYELIPPPSNASGVVANDIGSFIVDFRYIPSGNQSRVSLLYSATDSDHRWANLQNATELRTFSLEFSWYDYNNEKHPIILGTDGFAEVKMVFKKV